MQRQEARGGTGEVVGPRGSRPLRPLPGPFSHRVVARGPPEPYGTVIDSNKVHEEIRDLATRVKGVIENNFQKHATSEAQVLQGICRFGPSAQSKKIINRENEAAMLAFKTGVYAVWRCEQPKLSGSNTDFCTRVGYQHRCFCGHTLEEHTALKIVRGRVSTPQCQACACGGFNYMPNEPEEIGEGWLTRRHNWDPAKWSVKCRCSHGHKQHDPRTRSCKECGCSGFTSHFLCAVCDREGEAHATVFELEQERLQRGLPVREAYFPLMTLDWSLRELVLEDPTGGGALTAPPSRPVLEAGEAPSSGKCTTSQRMLLEKLPVVPALTPPPPPPPPPPPQYCTGCGKMYRSAQVRFCSSCGKQRQ
ncbi:putative protein-like [Trypanosoma rangeli]|uniref:Protein FAM221B n=1 Tax=Trypanosoma rangeli TaxID=5698 RepID=A0A422NWL4_TRYRA|nr:putative protein-like [Trypanosoma rangeli]RNF09870.1 putative protein-like [Trypanosoma rangeli]|eukprot:RNF09870.1 putative protein-like [Trypanosoma rangeli]